METKTISDIIAQLEQSNQELQDLTNVTHETGDFCTASKLATCSMNLEEIIEKLKICNFEKRQTALW